MTDQADAAKYAARLVTEQARHNKDSLFDAVGKAYPALTDEDIAAAVAAAL